MSRIQTKQAPAKLKNTYQALLVSSHLLSLTLYILLVKCLCDIGAHSFQTIAILFGLLYMASFALLLNFLSPKLLSILIQFSSHTKELPLAFISFYHFTHVSYLPATTNFQYYYLLAASVLFSAIGILNCIVAEKFLWKTSFSPVRLFFLFKFRLFYFIARLIGLATFLSSGSDTLATRDSNYPSFLATRHLVNLTFTLYLLIQFVSYFFWYWFYCDKSASDFFSHTPSGRQVATRLLKTSFESVKLLIDFNDKFFRSKRVLFKKFGLTLTLNCVKLLAFATFQVVVQASLAFFWYVRALQVFKADQSKTTLFSLLTKVRTRINLVNLYELEIKLKHRQLELITITGCLIVAGLSYHIFYTYYDQRKAVTMAIDVTSPETRDSNYPYVPETKRRSLTREEVMSIERARKSIDDKRLGFIEERIDGFSIDTYQQSSSMGNSSMSSDSFMSPKYKYHKSVDPRRCSTCSSTGDSSFTDSSKSFSSALREKKLPRGLFRSQSVLCKGHVPRVNGFHTLPRRRAYEYESSSGVDSSTTGTSRSTVFDYNDLNYLKSSQVTPLTYETEHCLGPNRVEFTVGNLNRHNGQLSESEDKDFSEKVKGWFNKRHEMTHNLNSTFKFSQDENRLGESYVI